jgi:hypothetical protein
VLEIAASLHRIPGVIAAVPAGTGTLPAELAAKVDTVRDELALPTWGNDRRGRTPD